MNMNAATRFALFSLGLLAVIFFAGLDGYRKFLRADMSLVTEPTIFEVQRGATASGVVADLRAVGRLANSPYWSIWLRFSRVANCLQAGQHMLPVVASPTELASSLCSATRRPAQEITVEEGLNIFEIHELLRTQKPAIADDFIALATDPQMARKFGIEAESLEGYLFPETHEIFADASAEQLIEIFFNHGKSVRESLNLVAADPVARKYSWHELLTIASIVEKEAQAPEERPLIARVIYNRLEKSMKLQCDPTCVYSREHYNLRASPALCRNPQNRFSTYVIPALPPTPIANPGLEAIRATLQPTENPDVLYFVAMMDGTGRHAFANTLAEHDANVTKYLRQREPAP